MGRAFKKQSFPSSLSCQTLVSTHLLPALPLSPHNTGCQSLAIASKGGLDSTGNFVQLHIQKTPLRCTLALNSGWHFLALTSSPALEIPGKLPGMAGWHPTGSLGAGLTEPGCMCQGSWLWLGLPPVQDLLGWSRFLRWLPWEIRVLPAHDQITSLMDHPGRLGAFSTSEVTA